MKGFSENFEENLLIGYTYHVYARNKDHENIGVGRCRRLKVSYKIFLRFYLEYFFQDFVIEIAHRQYDGSFAPIYRAKTLGAFLKSIFSFKR